MDFADAGLVRAAEREGIETVFTVDRKDFAVYRPLRAAAHQDTVLNELRRQLLSLGGVPPPKPTIFQASGKRS